MGYTYQGIIQIDMNSFEIQVISDWYKDYEKLSTKKYRNLFNLDISILEKYIFLPMPNGNYVARYNIPQKKMEFYEVEGEDERINTICYQEKSFWITGDTNKILKCSIEEIVSVEKAITLDITDYTDDFFTSSYYKDEKIYFMNQKSAQEMDVKTYQLKEVNYAIEQNRISFSSGIIKELFMKMKDGNTLMENIPYGITVRNILY